MIANAMLRGRRLLSSAVVRRLTSETSPSATSTSDVSRSGSRSGSGGGSGSGLGPKRFYDKVGIRSDEGNGKERTEHTITLDGKTIRTPQGGTLQVPTLGLATAVAEEWDAQSGRIRPSSMPLTRLVYTARDIIPDGRAQMQASLLRYIDTDSVCLRPAEPASLVTQQDAACWKVVHTLRQHGAELRIVRGGLRASQSEEVASWMGDRLSMVDDYSLAAVDGIAGCAKSVAVAIAVLLRMPVEHAVEAARAEEMWQARVWGSVDGGHDLDHADVDVRLRAADALIGFAQCQPDAFPKSDSLE